MSALMKTKVEDVADDFVPPQAWERAWALELEKRCSEIDSGAVKMLTHEEVMHKLHAVARGKTLPVALTTARA